MGAVSGMLGRASCKRNTLSVKGLAGQPGATSVPMLHTGKLILLERLRPTLRCSEVTALMECRSPKGREVITHLIHQELA